MFVDATLLNMQYYEVLIEGKMAQYREWSIAPHPYTSVW